MPRMSTLASALALALAGSTAAQAQTFSGVISFGDSLTDAGNVALVDGNPFTPPGSSFTTNPDSVAAQIISMAFGFPQTNSLSGGSNFAFGGACVRANSVSFTCGLSPGSFSITTQLTTYLTLNGGHADGNALYTMWGGANDIFTYAGLAGAGFITGAQAQQFTGVSAITEVGLIGSLQAAGAHYIVVFNLPDIGKTPAGVASGATAAAALSGLSFVYNETLNAGLATLADGIIPINVNGLVNEVMADPSAYGFTNISAPACGTLSGSLACGPAGDPNYFYHYAPGTNSTWLFADGVHPTGGAHQLLANAVIATIAAPGQVSFAGEVPLQVYDVHSGVINSQLFANRHAERGDEDARGYAHFDFGKQKFDAAANTGALDLNQFTGTFGADYMPGDTWTLGGAVSFGASNGQTGGAGLHSREVLASVYASANVGSVGYIDAIASAGSSNIDINRSIVLGPTTRIDSGTTTAKDIGFELGGGLAFGDENFQHGPFISAAWQKVTVDGYAEENTDSTAMWFSKFERKSLVGRVGYQLQGTAGNFQPYLRVAYAQENENDPTRVQGGSNTMNGHFTMNGFTPADHWAEANVGVSYQANDSTQLVFSYNGRFSDNTQSRDSVAFMVRKTWGKAAVPAGEPTPEPMPEEAPAKTCADMDDDGDSVTNCDDKCPNSSAGQAVGPDGCPVPLTIDLKGVNFDFDKSTLRPDAVAILDEAVGILTKYPDLKVLVAGHTDSVGSEQYNQGLSERRARTVYDYLTAHGIDAGRLVGPQGFGETKPIDSNDTKEGRARNRRTELDVQN